MPVCCLTRMQTEGWAVSGARSPDTQVPRSSLSRDLGYLGMWLVYVVTI
jgi:hypothetical protein